VSSAESTLDEVLASDNERKNIFIQALVEQQKNMLIDNLIKDMDVAVARKKLNDLREAVSCIFCTETARPPMITPCGHTFCATCLDQWESMYITSTKPCPACRTPYWQAVPNIMMGHVLDILGD
jgi:hypothetical protein